jgi:RNA polymerase-binding transcription factor DksA
VAAARSKPRSTPAGAAHPPGGSPARGAGATGSAAQSQRLRVRENEKPWTVSELATVRLELEADVARLQNEILVAEFDLAGLMRDIGDGAGDDPADAGTATFEREQEISLANNAREVFEQSARALARLLDGSYGICESCGSPIGKNRLLAFPRATLCMTCKSKQERR